MSLAAEKIQEAREALEKTLKHLDQGNKRLAIGALDVVKEATQASIYILIDEVIEKEGKF